MKTNINRLFLVSALAAGLALWLPGRAAAATYSVIKSFTGSDGANPYVGLTLSGSTLYGTTRFGGSSGAGTVFKVNTNGSGYTVLYNFAGAPTDGENPSAALTLSGSTLYGTTDFGGSSGNGTVFKITTNGSGYTVLYNFAGAPTDGADPRGGVTLSGSTLYGTTVWGGSADRGTVFKITTNGSGYTVLYNFAGVPTDGQFPHAVLTLFDSTLYGTTGGGGSSGNGTVFKITTNGSGYTVLYNFAGAPTDGMEPRVGLTLFDSTLYGTTDYGGSSGNGTVFKITTNGSGYTVLYNFAGAPTDGATPAAALTLSGSTLYGTTDLGGRANVGTVFKITTNGSGYTVLKNFTSSPNDGAYPYGLGAGLTLSGSTLYGATDSGGSSSVGTVFRMDDINVNVPVAAKNDVVPTSPAGAKFGTFGVPAVNIAGNVAFKATLLNGFGGVVGSNNIAIYAGSPGAETLVVRASNFAPDAIGMPTTARFLNFTDPVYNNAGEIAFRGTLKVAGSVTSANDTGLWSTHGSTNHLVAREGDVAPDTGGAIFATFTSFALPDAGDVVFIGKLLVAGPVTTTNNVGIWVYDSSLALRKLTRTGDSTLVNTTNKILKTLTFLPAVAYSPGQSRSFNVNGGQLVYRAAFTDGTTAILSSSYP